MSFFVLDPGLGSRIVDLGRPASRSLGVPVGGAADVASLTLGNALVGNVPDAPALEVTLKGPILRAETEVGCVLFGAPFDMSTARQSLKAGRTFTLEPAEELHITGTPRGLRAYLCVPGGFAAVKILGSASGLDYVRAGTVLSCRASRLGGRSLSPAAPFPDLACELRCLDGLQKDWFAVHAFYEAEFTASSAMNRMGIRLQGQPLTLPERELVSEPVCPGSVQVTRDGQCIVLGVDGQTIGGYPKIAQVIQADMDRLGQLRPGAKVRFGRVDEIKARELFLQGKAILKDWSVRSRTSIGIMEP